MRLLVIVIALVGAGFLVVQERGARAADRLTGAALTAKPPSVADERRATKWNPDTQPTLDFAIAEARAGEFDQAGARLVAVTRVEPRNARAWTLLCTVAKRYDSDLAATACPRARDLAPPVPRGSLNRSSGRSTT